MTQQSPLADRVLVPVEAAELLGLTVPKLLQLAERGAIPGVCLGGEWRFSRRRLQRLTELAA